MRTIKAFVAGALLSLAAAPAALADTSYSTNWAGYAVHRGGVRFNQVVGTWRQPSASCVRGQPTFSAYWVGIGGYSASSQALEQIGTEVDCTSSGRVSSSSWYELVPAPSRNIRMTVRPHDLMAARVDVSGRRVTLTLTDDTTHRSFKKVLRGNVDITSAEWIAESPSECFSADQCETLPLAAFGSVSFAHAGARSTSGRNGTISSRSWAATRIYLSPGGRRYATLGNGATVGTASPSGLSAGGSVFSVRYGTATVGISPFMAQKASVRPGGYLVHPTR